MNTLESIFIPFVVEQWPLAMHVKVARSDGHKHQRLIVFIQKKHTQRTRLWPFPPACWQLTLISTELTTVANRCHPRDKQTLTVSDMLMSIELRECPSVQNATLGCVEQQTPPSNSKCKSQILKRCVYRAGGGSDVNTTASTSLPSLEKKKAEILAKVVHTIQLEVLCMCNVCIYKNVCVCFIWG